ncbi:MAG: tetratricopeptide repeat protein [Chloroflexota bacterium]
MANEMRIRRDRSSLSNGAMFGRRRRGLQPWKLMLWLAAMGFMGLVIWQFDKIQPQVLALVGTAPTATPPAIFFAQAADLAYWHGDLDTAITNYRLAAKQQQTNADILYELARMLIYRSYADRRNAPDIAEAVEWANKAVESNPNSSRAYTIQCFALITDEKTEDAVRSCIRATDLNPNESEAYAYLSSAYFELGRYDTSLDAAQKAVELNDKSIDGHTNLGLALRYKGRNTAALEEYKKAADINPQLEFPYFNLAYFAIGLSTPAGYEIAITAYNRVLSMNKRSVKAYTRLCETYYRMGETNPARDNCENAITLDPNFTTAYKWLGQVLYTRRNYEDAITNFKTCADQELADTTLKPEDRFSECWYLRGLAFFLLGQCDQANAIFNDLLTWTRDKNAIEKTNIGIRKCADAYQGRYTTPTPVPTPTEPPEPIQ